MGIGSVVSMLSNMSLTMLSRVLSRLVTWFIGMAVVVLSFVLSKLSVSVLVYLLARLVVTEAPKLASLLRAAASSFRVSRTAGALLMRVLILLPNSVLQKLVVAAVLSLLN